MIKSRPKIRSNNSDLEHKIALLIEAFLREAPDEALRIAKSWSKSRKTSKGIWQQTALEKIETTNDIAQAIEIPELFRLAAFLKNHPTRGIVLTTIHMGDYLHAIFAILKELPERDVLIVRRKGAEKTEIDAFSKLSRLVTSYGVVRTSDRQTGLKILRGLKRGIILVVLFDLPRSFGETSKVEFLGTEMDWVLGPVKYAALSGAFLVPFISYKSSGVTYTDLQPVIAMDRNMDLPSEMQALVQIAESYVKKYPDQWLHWNRLPEFLPPDE